MNKAPNNKNQKIESFEPMILMSASAAEQSGIDLDGANVFIADGYSEGVVGTDADEVFVGLGGDNCLHGEGGNDLFFTSWGFNEIDGGDGDMDTIRYLGNRADFEVISQNGGFLISDAGSHNGIFNRTDWVRNVEKFEFSDGVVMAADLLSGNAAPEFQTPNQFYVDENQTAVTTVEATDADGDTVTYSLGTAADGNLFDIDPNTGVLTFKNAPDFENPLDFNGDNTYDVFVKASDGKTSTIHSIWVTVKDVDEGGGGGNQSPFFTNVADGEMILVDENTTLVRDTDGQDPDGDTVTFSISDGIGIPGSGDNEDAGAFTIDANTGVLSFKVAPDFETPGDADGDNEYAVTIVIADGNGGAQERDVVVKVQDVQNKVNKLFEVPENTTPVGPQADAAVNVFSLSGTDASLFNIDAFGNLSFKNAPDFENPGDADGDNDYKIIRTIQVLNGEDIHELITVRVTDVNEGGGGGNQAPFFTNIPANKMVTTPENQTFAFDVDATDPNGDPITYALVGGPDDALFNIDANTGVITFKNAPDFENPGDANGDNAYQVSVWASDGSLSTDDTLIIKVTDVNEGGGGGGNQAPFFTNVEEGEMVTVPENTTLVGDANGIDPDGDSVTFSIAGGPDAALFTVNAQTGVVSFINAPDFENPGDADGNNEYNITLRISDGKGGVQDRNVVVKVTDSDVGGVENRAPFFTNVEEGEMVFVVENTKLVGDANGVDPDGDPVTFSIVGGADASLFTINAQTGVVSFINAPDFENPGDADGNNEYNITLRISDGKGGLQDRNVVVKVVDANDTGGGGNRAPFFTNVEEGEMVFVVENTTLVGDANGIDPDGDPVTFSIVGGADASLFTINAQTGVVSFINAPDFENPGDADGNNEYNITLRISDGKGGLQDRNVVVKVVDANDTGGGGNRAPFFTNVEEGEIVTVPENTTPVGDANGIDPDGDPVTYSIVGGADSSLFTINAQTGWVSFINAPDFENPGDADGNNNYQITLRISDGSLSQDRNVTVRVTDVGNEGGGGLNQAPFFTNVSQGETVSVVTGNTLVGDADAQDPNGDPVTYSISGGADAALFTVNAQTGVVSFINAPDVNNPGDADGDNNYQITLRASDGSLFQDRDVTVNVIAGNQQQNRAPFFTNVEQGEVVWFDENNTFVGDANAVDLDGDVVTFSIVGGADSAQFTINPQTGQLFFLNAPDFENPVDADGNNRYEVQIRVSDGQAFQDRSVTVNVEDVNEGGNTGGGGSGSGGGQSNNFFPWLNNSFFFSGYKGTPHSGGGIVY